VQQLVQRSKITEYLKTLRAESKTDWDKLTAALTTYATTPKEVAKDATASAPKDKPAEAPKP
jgi:hypothetical protein